VINFVV